LRGCGEYEQDANGVMETMIRLLGEDHPDTLTSMNNLAITYNYQGHETEELHLRVLEERRKVLGENHPDRTGNQRSPCSNDCTSRRKETYKILFSYTG
jgi:hypothetical protein